MLTVEQPRPGAVVVTASGRLTREEVRQGFADWHVALHAADRTDILQIVEAGVSLTLGAVAEDLAHALHALDGHRRVGRIGVVAPPGWVTAVSRMEAKLVPAFDMRVFPPEQLAAARAWVLDGVEPPPQA